MPTPDNFTPLIYLGVITLGLGFFLALAGFDIVKVEKVSVRPGRPTWVLGIFLIFAGGVFLLYGGAFSNRNNPPPVAPTTTPSQELLTSTPASTPTSPPSEPTATPASPTEPAPVDPRQLLSEAQNWHKVMEDGFSTNANSWDLAATNDSNSIQTLEINDDVLKWGMELADPGRFYLEIAPVFVPSNFYYSARIRRLPGEGNPGAWWGLFFRRQGYLGYAFIVNDRREYWVGRMDSENDAAKWVPLIGVTFAPTLKANEWNTLTVVMQQAHMTFFINGEPAGEVDDDTLTVGNVGFYAGLDAADVPVNFEFDDFELRAAP